MLMGFVGVETLRELLEVSLRVTKFILDFIESASKFLPKLSKSRDHHVCKYNSFKLLETLPCFCKFIDPFRDAPLPIQHHLEL